MDRDFAGALVTMGAPFAYARECGPAAFAAVTGLPVEDAANILWGHRSPPLGWRFRGTYGTWPHDIGAALVRLGFDVEVFDGGGVRWLDAREYVAFLANLAHREAKEVRYIRPAPRPRGPRRMGYATPAPYLDPNRALPAGEQIAKPLTVAGWLRAFPASTWVLFVRGHVLAARAGQIITDGDEHYRRHYVWDALRVSKPEP